MPENILQTKQIELTYRVSVALHEGFIVPDSIKTLGKWTPLRHAVLLNEYMKWCKAFRGSKQKFAVDFLERYNKGEFPILNKTIFDDSEPDYTLNGIMSQIDWMAQKENQVITEVPNSTIKEFYPNNLLAMTSKQKASEARKSLENKMNSSDDLVRENKLRQALEAAGYSEAEINRILESTADLSSEHS